MTTEQAEAVLKLFKRNSNGFATYEEFEKSLVKPMIAGGGAIAVDPWCGLYVGIETDGFTHS